MSHAAILSDGAPIEALAFAGEHLTLRTSRAFAPGQPMEFSLKLKPPLSLKGRSGGAKRQPDGSFVVRTRLVNLTRGQREALEASLPNALALG